MTLELLVSFECSQVLGQIILQLVTSIFITNFLMHDEKLRKLGGVTLMWLHKRAMIIKPLLKHHINITLTLHNHVVHDNTIIHDLPLLIYRSCLSRVPYISKTRLEHIKCPLHTIPKTLFSHKREFFFLLPTELHSCNSPDLVP